MRIYDARRHPRLALALPSEWEPLSTDSERAAFAVNSDVSVHIRWLVPMWADYGSWVQNVMSEPFASPRLTQRAFEHCVSERGWPIVFAHYQIHSASGDLLGERVGVFYRLLHVGAEVIVRLRGETRWSEHADVLRPVITNGHIEWPRCEPDDLYTLLGMNE